MGYLLASAEEVFKTKREPFIKSIEAIATTTGTRAAEVFNNLSYGGLHPDQGQYGPVTLRPEMFYGASGNPLVGSFRQSIASTGWIEKFLSTDLSEKGPVGEKWVMGLYGISILDPVKRITQIQLRKGSNEYPVIDIESAQFEAKPVTILFKLEDNTPPEDFVFDYSAKFFLDVYATSTGYQTIKPEGVAYLPVEPAVAKTY